MESLPLKFKVTFSKNAYDVEMEPSKTVGDLKQYLEEVTKVPVLGQKLMYKGQLKDDARTLQDVGIKNDSKIMLVGTTIEQMIAATSLPVPPPPPDVPVETAAIDPLALQTQHKKIIDKGVPEDAEMGNSLIHLPLPSTPLQGILNHRGDKVRLTFRTDLDQLWIASKTHTQKLQFGSIQAITSEPIVDHQGYHIMALQLGASANSKYYLYFVPAQYVQSIKDCILGQFAFF
eukprot:GILJ01002928.1.p1 GENE.GILJ01002928.1~~GILJ01002928.1.p1  ORF type:complete len:266 (-),score=31.88 GILJ01002928.1:200-895(-)